MQEQEERFKQAVISSVGQAEVTEFTSPNCDMLGPANESQVVVGDFRCLALIDTGSMFTSIGEAFHKKHLEDKYPLQELSDLLQVEGAGGHPLQHT